MKDRLLIFVYTFVFWTVFFLVSRGLFLISQFELASQLEITDIIRAFTNGVRMDLSTAGWLTVIPGLILAFTFWLKPNYVWFMWYLIMNVFLLYSSVIISVDFELYKHWGFRMDTTPLFYISKEGLSSISIWRLMTLVIYVALIGGAGSWVAYRVFKKRFEMMTPTAWKPMPILLVLTAILIIPIRGSFGVAPMNSGFVYFHQSSMFANHAAINVIWNFTYSLGKAKDLKYPDDFFDRDSTTKGYNKLFRHDQSSARLIQGEHPNVIVIIMESYTFGFVEALGGLPGIAPNFNKLVSEGILFDNFYSSGDRTDKGLLAILSGYPAQPLASIVKYPGKTSHLPFLNSNFKRMGYRTEFTFGNDIDYANFRSYLINAQFDHLTHSEDFPAELNEGKWGVHDEFVFKRFFEEAEKASQPFFKMMMTLSSHEPFDVPMEPVIKGNDHLSRFSNSAYYADKCLGEFIDQAKQSSWWDNTLVIITADHGHPLPDNRGVGNIKRFKIPMLWLGGALTVQDTVIHTIGGQPDIANTLLSQFGMTDSSFTFSNNLLSSYDPFAVFVFNNGFGMVQQQGHFVFDNNVMSIMKKQGSVSAEQIELGKAYMQKLYWDFNSR